MTVSGGLFCFLIFSVLRVEPFFVFDGFGEPARMGVMMTTVELVDGICRLVETVHRIGSEFLFFPRIYQVSSDEWSGGHGLIHAVEI